MQELSDHFVSYYFFVIFQFFLFQNFQSVLTGREFESKQERTGGSSLEGNITHVLPPSILIFSGS